MARIIGGSMIGELSGKLGGQVFARNRAGAYVRQYVIPVDPNTAAQVKARSSFGSAASSYHSLEDTVKSQWNDFALYRYLPKNGSNTGQYSGFNAFTALGQAAINAEKQALGVSTIEFVGPDINPTSLLQFSLSQTPPAKTVQGNLLTSSGGIATIQMTGGSFTTDGSFTATLSINGGTGTSGVTLPDQLVDGNENPIGFTFYISNAVQQEHMFIANPEVIQVGSVGVPTVATGTATAVTGIEIEGLSIDPAEYKNFPSAGSFVRLSTYIITQHGQMIRIGSITVEVEEP